MKYLIFLLFPLLSFSQTKRYYVTPESAKLITKKITDYNKVSTELLQTKKELFKVKRELKTQDSLNTIYIDRLDSMYVDKMSEDRKKYNNQINSLESLITDNKKIKKQNKTLKFLVFGLTATFGVLYLTK